MILYVVDSSVPLDENDMDIMQIIGSKRCVVLLSLLMPDICDKHLIVKRNFSLKKHTLNHFLKSIKTCRIFCRSLESTEMVIDMLNENTNTFLTDTVDVCVIGAGHAGCEAALACAL